MNKLVVTFTVAILTGTAHAQSRAGITGIPDTSYSMSSAFANTRKTNPDAEMVPEVQNALVKEQRGIVYCEVGQRKLVLDAFYPSPTGKKRIAIIIIHGGGWRTGNRSLHYALAQHLAALGYVCFTPEYRLSTEALYPAAIYDIKSAIQWVRKNARRYNVDTTRIVAMGHSAGGEIAAFMGSTNNDISFIGDSCNKGFSENVNAVVDIDGLLAFIHPESGEGDDSKRTSSATYWFGYSKTENPSLWIQASPLSHVNGQAAPILFLNSSVDRMHAGRDDYVKALRQYNIYSEVKTYGGAPHSFCFFEPWFKPMVTDITMFLDKVFKN